MSMTFCSGDGPAVHRTEIHQSPNLAVGPVGGEEAHSANSMQLMPAMIRKFTKCVVFSTASCYNQINTKE